MPGVVYFGSLTHSLAFINEKRNGKREVGRSLGLLSSGYFTDWFGTMTISSTFASNSPNRMNPLSILLLHHILSHQKCTSIDHQTILHRAGCRESSLQDSATSPLILLCTTLGLPATSLLLSLPAPLRNRIYAIHSRQMLRRKANHAPSTLRLDCLEHEIPLDNYPRTLRP